MTTTELLTLLLFCAAMTFSPGPNTTLAAAIGTNFGLRHAMRFCLAVPTGWVLLMLATAVGLGALVLSVPALRWAVKLVGVTYMLWLAFKLTRIDQGASADISSLDVGFWRGVGLQFVNIKAWLLALTLASGWMLNSSGLPAANPGERLLIICAFMVVFAFTSNLAYAAAGSLLRRHLASPRRLAWFNRMLALVLAATAAWMVVV